MANSPKHPRPGRRRRWAARAAIAWAACSALNAAADVWDPVPGIEGPGDGLLDGGSGTWNVVDANWTIDNGATNTFWVNSSAAVFGGAIGGDVTVAGNLQVASLQFDATADLSLYTLISPSALDTLTLIGPNVTAHQDANINAILAGSSGFTKLGSGTIILGASNTFTGVITVSAGTLGIANDANLGDPSNNVLLQNGATLRVTANLDPVGSGWGGSTRVFTLGTGGGVIEVVHGATFTLNDPGQLAGATALTKTGAGNLSLGAAGVGYTTLTGPVVINAGTVELWSDQAAGTGTITINSSARLVNNGLNVANNLVLGGGTLTFAGNYATNSGAISVAASSTIAVSVSGKTLTLSGILSGTNAITVDSAGGGALAITNPANFNGSANPFTGNVSLIGAGSATLGYRINAPSGQVFSASAGTLTLGNSIPGAMVRINDGASIQSTGGTIHLHGRSAGAGVGVIIAGDVSASGGGQVIIGDGADDSAQIQFANTADLVANGGTITVRPRLNPLTFDVSTVGTISIRDGGMLAVAGNADFTLNRDVANSSGAWILANQSPNLFRIAAGSQESTTGLVLRADAGTIRYETDSITIGTAQANGTLNVDLRGGTVDINNAAPGKLFNYASGHTLSGYGQIGVSAANQTHVIAAGGATFHAIGPGSSVLSIVGGIDESSGGKALLRVGDSDAISLTLPTPSIAGAYRINSFVVDAQSGTGFARLILPTGFALANGTVFAGTANKLRFEISGSTLISDLASTGAVLLTGGSAGASVPILVSNGGAYISTATTFTLKSSEYLGTSGTLFGFNGTTTTNLDLDGVVELNGTIGGAILAGSTGTLVLNAGSATTLGAAADLTAMKLSFAGVSGAANLELNAPSATARIGINTQITNTGAFAGTRQFTATAGTLQIDAADAATVSITGNNTLVIDRTSDSTANPTTLGVLSLVGGAFQIGTTAGTTTVASGAVLSGRGTYGHAGSIDTFINSGTVSASGGTLTVQGGIKGSGAWNPAGQVVSLVGGVADNGGTPTQLRIIGGTGGRVDLNNASTHTGGTLIDGSAAAGSVTLRLLADGAMSTGAITINSANLTFNADGNLFNTGKTPPITVTGTAASSINFGRLVSGLSKQVTVGSVAANGPSLTFNGNNSYTLSVGGITAGSSVASMGFWGSAGGATVYAGGMTLNSAMTMDIGGVTLNTGRLAGAGSITRTWDSGKLNFTTAAGGFTGAVFLLAGESNFNASNTLSGGTWRFGGKNVYINSPFALNQTSGIIQSATVTAFVNLNAANSLSGADITFNSGNMYANVPNALGTGNITLSGGKLYLWNDPSTAFGGGSIVGTGTNVSQLYVDRSKNGVGINGTHSITSLTLQSHALQLYGSNGYGLSIPGGIMVAAGGSSSLSHYASNLITPTLTLNSSLAIIGTGPATIGQLGGTGALSWTNTGALTITSTPLPGYSGLLQLPNGSLNLNIAGALSGGSAQITGGAMNLGASNAVAGLSITMSSGFINANVPSAMNQTTVQMSDGTIMAIADDAMGNAVVQMTGGNVTAAAPYALGTSSITMNGAILALRGDGSASFGGSVTITGTATATLSAGPITTEFGPVGQMLLLNQLSLGGQIVNITGSNDYILGIASPVAMSGTDTTTFNATAADALFQGALTGGGAIIKNGVRTVTLGGGGSFGATTVNAGTLVVNEAWTTSGVTVGDTNGAAILEMGGGGVNAPGNFTIANGTLRIAKSNPAAAVPPASQVNTASAGDATIEYAGLAGGSAPGIWGNAVNVNLAGAARKLTISSASGTAPGQPSNFLWTGLVTSNGSNALTVAFRADPPLDDGLGNLVRSPSRLIVSGAQTFSTPLVHGGGIVIAKGASIPNGTTNNPLGRGTAALSLNLPDSTIGGMVADGQTSATFSRNAIGAAGAPRARLGAFFNPSGGTGAQTVSFTASMAWNEGSAPLFGVMPAGNPAGAMNNSTWNGLIADPGAVLQINSGATPDNILTVAGSTITSTAPIYVGGGGTVRINAGFDETSYRNLTQTRGLAGTVTVLDGTMLQSLTSGHHFDGVELRGGSYHVSGSIQSMSGGFAVNTSPFDSSRIAGNLLTDSNFSLNGTGTARALRIGAGQKLVKSGAGVFTINADQSHGYGAILQVDAGAVNLNTDAGMNGTLPAAKNLTISAGGSSTVNLAITQHLVNVAIGQNAMVKLASSATIGQKVLAVNSLSITGGKLDLTNNNAVIDYTGATPIAGIRALLQSGYNASGAHWTGNGIISSSAAANDTMALGYAEASAILGASGGVLWGETIDGTALLVKYTKMGDADLNGTVDFSDLVLLSQNYNMAGGASWHSGDFNYDGAVDFADLVVVAQNYGQTAAGPLPDAVFSNDWAQALGAVPEPGGIALAAIAAMMGLSRRRRTTLA